MSSQETNQPASSYICGKCGRQYRIPQIRFCPHPKTNREDGAYICYCCCQRCAFSSNDHLCGAINCDVFITNRYLQGVFWVIDGNLIYIKEPSGVPKKHHKKEWENLSTEITNGKKYNHYPMGRVDLRYNKAVIYLQPAICTDPIKKKIVEESNLENVVYQIIETDDVSY